MSERSIEVAAMDFDHWPSVREIYAQGIASGNATFETEAPDWREWDQSHLPTGRFVALLDGVVVGWAALSPVSDRCAYSGVAEVSVYVGVEARGRGVGARLMGVLVSASEALGIWTLQAGVFPENDASVRVHTRVGFRLVGRRERLGEMQGAWRDVLLLERRSTEVGTAGEEGAALPSGS